MQAFALSLLLKIAEYFIDKQIDKAKAADQRKSPKAANKVMLTKARVENIYNKFA